MTRFMRSPAIAALLLLPVCSALGDVGGEGDQALYKPGNVRFVLELPAKEQREFFFLLRSPDCRQLPDMSLGLWNRETLRKAAADVWKDRWQEAVVAEADTPE